MFQLGFINHAFEGKSCHRGLSRPSLRANRPDCAQRPYRREEGESPHFSPEKVPRSQRDSNHRRLCRVVSCHLNDHLSPHHSPRRGTDSSETIVDIESCFSYMTPMHTLHTSPQQRMECCGGADEWGRRAATDGPNGRALRGLEPP